jgi:uncharacterized protein (TIGR03067 family)
MKRYASLLLAAGLLLSAAPPQQREPAGSLDGTWTMVRGEQDGKPLADDVVHAARLTIVGNKHNVKVGEETFVGTHRLDQRRRPKTIDAMDTEGTLKGKTSLGIYELEGDEFTVCFAAPGKDRPTKFTTKSGTGTMLHVWKRQKE